MHLRSSQNKRKVRELFCHLHGNASVDTKEIGKQEAKQVLAHSKIAMVALALVLGCSSAVAQDDPSGPPPDNGGNSGSMSDGMGMRGRMRQGGPGQDGGNWNRGGTNGGGWNRGRDGFGLSRLLRDPDVRKQLGVSDEQAAKIRQQESDFRKTSILGRADIQAKQVDLRDLMSADKPDRAAIDAKLQDISSARLSLQKSAVDYRLNSRDSLTPDQRDKLRQIMRDRRQQGGGPGQRGPRAAGSRGQGGGQRGGPRGAGAPPPKAQTATPPSQ
jgi:Spy/CpxP family protein refolding chaperone